MAIDPLPDFERSLALAQGNLDAAELAETHGAACGLLVRLEDASLDAFLNVLATLEIIQEPGPALASVFEELLNATRDQLADEAFRLDLWLPEDEDGLEERTEALAQWCNGFLASLGAGNDPRIDTLSGEAAEALADIQEIALAELGGEPGTSEASEEEETAYAEIVEYVRIAALILREELRGPRHDDSIH